VIGGRFLILEPRIAPDPNNPMFTSGRALPVPPIDETIARGDEGIRDVSRDASRTPSRLRVTSSAAEKRPSARCA